MVREDFIHDLLETILEGHKTGGLNERLPERFKNDDGNIAGDAFIICCEKYNDDMELPDIRETLSALHSRLEDHILTGAEMEIDLGEYTFLINQGVIDIIELFDAEVRDFLARAGKLS